MGREGNQHVVSPCAAVGIENVPKGAAKHLTHPAWGGPMRARMGGWPFFLIRFRGPLENGAILG